MTLQRVQIVDDQTRARALKGTIKERIVKLIDRTTLKEATSFGLFCLGTVAMHNLNVGGLITWFGKRNDSIETGLPYPFHKRIRFPWEKQSKPTFEDKLTEWAVPALMSWIMVYHPEAVARFIDAIVPL